MKIDNLTNKTYEELRKIASKKKIKGRSKMNKKELIKSIKKIVKIMKLVKKILKNILIIIVKSFL